MKGLMRGGLTDQNSLEFMRVVGKLIRVRVAAYCLLTLLQPSSALLNQCFGPAKAVRLPGGWQGLERSGVAGVDAFGSATTGNRQLSLLPRVLQSRERQSLLAELERRRFHFETDVLDTVDAQSTFMCRVIEGGKALDSPLAAQLAPLCGRLQEYVQQKYACDTACISELLIRRYLPNERRRLEAHFDVSAFATAIVSLSAPNEYEGGLYVQAVPGVPSRRYVALEGGDALVHRFDTMHGVHVPSGARYSLVVWFSQSAQSLSDGTAPWVCEAAENGNAEAQFVLGGFYYRGGEFGYGPADLNLAVRWLAASAHQNNPLAQVHLASMISAGEIEGELLDTVVHQVNEGTTAPPDSTDDSAGGGRAQTAAVVAAAELYRRAAAAGHPSGQFALGRCYLHGTGMSHDVVRAREWLQRAAAQGADENIAAAWAADELAALDAPTATETSSSKQSACDHK